MKKTMLLTHEYYPFAGGVARYCYNLFKYFDQQDYIVVTDHPEVPAKLNVINTKLTHPFLKPSWLWSFFKLKILIKRYKIEQIFTPNILPLGSLAYFLKIPYVISLHGLDINLALKNKPELTKKILTNARQIVVNTDNTKSLLDDLKLPDEKIRVVYPGIDFKMDYDEAKLEAFKNKLNINPKDKIILTVGRLNRRKGQDLVIKSLEYLKDDLPVKYFIVGQGETKAELEELIVSKKLQDRVFIFDRVEDEELIYYYKMADVFVMPNRHSSTDIEGFGMVFLEAAANQLPIIAGSSGGVTDILTHRKNALLVKNSDIRQLTRYIRELLSNNEEADKLAKQALSRYKEFNNAKQQSDFLKNIL